MEIRKITDGLVHLHDASNYAREALKIKIKERYADEPVVTTVVCEGMFHITARPPASLDGYTAKITLLNGGSADRVDPRELKTAIEAIKTAFKS